jgi:hypothetical protein
VVAKIVNLPEGVALLLDRDLLREVGLDVNSSLEVSAQGQSLVVSAVPPPERRRAFREALDAVNNRYEGTLRKLAAGPGEESADD